MQFLDIYIKEKFLIRVPLGEYDLMLINSGDWKKDVAQREQLLTMMMESFLDAPEFRKAKLIDPQFFIVFESKVVEENLVEA